MILHNSWKDHFLSLTTVNKLGDPNIPSFTGAMNFESTAEERMTALNKPNGFLLTANHKKEIILLHNPKNFGSTLLCPTKKIGCLLGIGHNAMPIIIDATAALQVVDQPLAKIVACSSINKLQTLPQPAANGIVNLKAINVHFPVPFLRNAILNEENSSPLAFILAALNAGIEHVNNHKTNADFDEYNENTHIELFVMWCMGVYQATVPKTCFSINPDDGELAAFGLRLHTKHIKPTTTTTPTGLMSGTSDVF